MTRAFTGADARPETARKLREAGSWEKRVMKLLTRQVDMEKEEDILMHHEYDGIRELDNVLPPWWVWLFYGTIAWGVIYLFNVHVAEIWPQQNEEYAQEMEQTRADVAAYMATLTNTVDENTVVASLDEGVLAAGKSVFTQLCSPCHGPDGAGFENSVGPNLTDAFWLHGGGAKNIFKTIKYGVPEKGMISWKNQLKPAEIAAVTSYIMSQFGKGGDTRKEAQGELWKEDATNTTDSTATQSDTTRVAAVQ
jgi:cytochrome c oxidase cbb3-type subunit 3